ncbi:Fanconi anemia group D2 proteinlike, partial [Caligus rogercresseyi]
KMETLSELERNVILSSFFYAINWYRELLNAFAPAEDTEYSVKVVSVLKIIVRLREQLRQALPFNPEFLPPSVLHSIDVSKWKPPVFSSNSSGATGKKPRGKGKKKKANLSESLISQTSQKGASQAMSSAEPSLTMTWRELDLDAFHILGYDTLAIEASPEDGLSLLNDIEELKNSSLRGRELLFLFKDIYSKLDHVLIAKAGPLKGFPGLGLNELKNAGFSNLDSLPKKSIAVFGVRIIEYVLANLEVISEYYGRLLKMSDCPQDDASLFDSNTPQLMLCSEFGLKILDKIFNWNGFGSKSNRALLKEGLSKLASRTKELMAASISYVIKFGETAFCSVGFAAAIVKLLDTLKNMDIINEDEDYDRINAQTLSSVKHFSRRMDKSAGMKKNVEYILNKFLSNQESTELLEKYIEELESEIFPSFSSFTLQIHFRALFASLIIYAHSLTFGVRQNHEEALESWSALILLLYKLVMVVKVAPSRALITIVARQSRIFLSHFIKLWDSQEPPARDPLPPTRLLTLQLKKDINLSNYVPLLKKTLETFVYRVKVTLAVNNCPEAFLMGNLKNRDLKGEEIKEDESEGEEDSSLHSENEEEGPQDEELDEDDESESPSNEDLRKSLSIEV